MSIISTLLLFYVMYKILITALKIFGACILGAGVAGACLLDKDKEKDVIDVEDDDEW